MRLLPIRFEFSSHLNSCAPNASVNFDVASFSSLLRVLRDVKEGEEIFVSYGNISRSTAERREKHAPYGFVCKCARCIDPNADKVCQDIVEGCGSISLQRTDPASAVPALKTCLKWLLLIQAQGLQELPAYYYYTRIAMEACMLLGKIESGKKYDKLSSAWASAYMGIPDELVLNSRR